MAICRDCGQSIEWKNVAGRWHATNPDGTIHNCRLSGDEREDIPPRDAYCAKCFKPIFSKTGNSCNHIEPVWIRKAEVQSAKKLLLRQAREQANAIELPPKAELKRFKCMLCGSTALKSTNSVVCLADFTHTFPLEMYDSPG
jgi:hypothetical protein